MLIDRLREEALRLGFESVGAAKAEPPRTFEHFAAWVAAGKHAGMGYLAKNIAARFDPNHILPGVRSLFMLGVSYRTVLESEPKLRQPFFAVGDCKAGKNVLRVASYACGVDYHDWIRERLRQLAALHRTLLPNERCRGVVDTAPLLERQYAAAAGLGRFGKNTMLIDPIRGSRFFLAGLLTTAALEYTESEPRDICGGCRACLDACPTGALERPYELDARKCLNYWTIEHNGKIPESIREKLGERFFGCEICQTVCPCNRTDAAASPGEGALCREEIEAMSPDEFKSRFARTPLARKML